MPLRELIPPTTATLHETTQTNDELDRDDDTFALPTLTFDT